MKRTVTTADVAAWADVADDHNPLHLDAEFAAGTRFGGPIVHGSLLFSLVCDAVQASGTTDDLSVRFRAPVLVGAEVQVDVDPAARTARLRCGDVDALEITVRPRGE